MDEPSPPGLVDMPEIVLHHIAEYVNFPGVMSMRKVCTQLRASLDDHPPLLSYKRVECTMRNDMVQAIFGEKKIVYCKYPPEQPVSYDGKHIFCGGEYAKMFSEDLALNVFKHKAKVYWSHIELVSSRRVMNVMRETFARLLNHRHQAQVENLFINVTNVNDLFLILPYIDSNTIKCIFFHSGVSVRRHALSVEVVQRLSGMDCWKNASRISIADSPMVLTSSVSLQHFLHLETFRVYVEELALEDLLRVKETMKQPTSQLEEAIIRHNRFPARNEFIRALGPCAKRSGEDWTCYFQYIRKKFCVMVQSKTIIIRVEAHFADGVQVSSIF